MRYALLGLLLAAPARASVKTTLEQTFGSRRYQDTLASVKIGEELYAKPSYEATKSDLDSQTIQTLGLEVGYDSGTWSAYGEAGFSPVADGYSSSYIGADGGPTWKFDDSLVESVGLSAGLRHTSHHDRVQFVATGPPPGNGGGQGGGGGDFRGGARQNRANPVTIGQTDLKLGGTVEAWQLELALDAERSLYNKNLDSIHAREVEVARVFDLDERITGYPAFSWSAELTWSLAEYAKPYLSFTHTQFELGDPASNGYGAGVEGKRGDFGGKLGYERYSQAYAAVKNYFTLEASYRFEPPLNADR